MSELDSLARHIAEQLLEPCAVSDSLTETELARLGEHLLACPNCQDTRKELHDFIAAIRSALRWTIN